MIPMRSAIPLPHPSTPRRPSRTVARNTVTAMSRRPFVVLEEDLAEVDLMGDEIDHAVTSECRDEIGRRALHRDPHRSVADLGRDHARRRAQLRQRRIALEAKIERATGPRLEAGDGVEHDESTGAHDADEVGDGVDLGQHVRGEHDGPALGCRLSQHGEEDPLHDRVETGRRFVEHQEVGAVLEGLDDADLLPVPVGERSDTTIEVDTEPFGELAGAPCPRAAVQVGEVFEVPPPGEATRGAEVPGEVADAGPDPRVFETDVGTEHLHRSRSGSEQPDEESQHRRLPSAVRPEEPEDAPFRYLEVEIRERERHAETLRETPGPNRVAAGHRA